MTSNDFLPFAAALALFLLGFLLAWGLSSVRFRLAEKKIRRDATRRQRAIVGGQVAEQLAPFLPDFPFQASEARFIGKPVDFIVFRGMDEKLIEEVVFVEVKTGKSSLSSQERRLKEAVEEGRISWYTYRVPAAENSG